MGSVSRRAFLGWGAAGVVALGTGVGGAVLLLDEQRDRLRPRRSVGLVEPEVVRGGAGELAITLVAALGRHSVAGREATTYGYNGGLPGPTLVVHPGDRLRLRLVNALDEVTNLHVHGLQVSPRGNGDNVFVEVGPGKAFDYEYQLPDDHPPGVYWYHPHHHGMVADQLYGGLYGAIVVEDPVTVAATRERLLVVSDLTLDRSGGLVWPSPMEQMRGREGELVLVNGQVSPVARARTGDRERWRLVNACTSRFLSLRLDGHELHLLGVDGGRFGSPARTESLLLAPGNRADLLVTVGSSPGVLRAIPYDRGGPGAGRGMGPGMGPGGGGPGSSAASVTLLSVSVSGRAPDEPGPLPRFPAPRDLRGEPVSRVRELVLAMGMGRGMGGMGGMGGGMGRGTDAMGGMTFTIDGRTFASGRVDQQVTAGAVEEWTIRNVSPMDHPFHLHVWSMQVVEVGGRVLDAPRWQDVVNVPARGTARVRVAFERVDGRTVYHCHVLDHEDRGMMGVVEVARAPS